MINELKAFFELFKQGNELANAAAWKNRQIAGNAVVSMLSAAVVISGGFGYSIPIDDATINAAGAGVAALVTLANAVLTVITSKKVGKK